MRNVVIAVVVLGLAPLPAGTAQECAPTQLGEELGEDRLLRQLTLDLLGRVPTMEEWERLDEGASIDGVFLPEFLASEEYFDVVREDHRALLWGSLGNIAEIGAAGMRIRQNTAASGSIWRLGNMRARFRGLRTLECLDVLQTDFDELGRPVPMEVTNDAQCGDPDGSGPIEHECRREGYVMVDPWWDRGTPVKVCAYDAQALSVGANGSTCDEYNLDAHCGCGPNLRRCMPRPDSDAQQTVRRGLAEEPARIFEGVVREGRNYLEAFTTRETWVNGPTAHYYRYQTGAVNNRSGQITYHHGLGAVPDLAYSEADQWRRITREEGHAGVLTTTAFLLRFASNRSRANRFYTAFRCEPFVPPAGGLPEETEANPHPNLRTRLGCRSCHERLEPLAATWGRWRVNGTHGFMAPDLLGLDEPLTSCLGCGGENDDGTPQRNCSALCNAYYVTSSNSDARAVADWGGRPLTRAWLTQDEALAIDEGPASLLDEPAEQQRVAQCTARTVAERMIGRPLTTEESLGWAASLSEAFVASDYDYTSLVRDVVSSEVYRTIR